MASEPTAEVRKRRHPLSPVEAELVRYAEDAYQQAIAAAKNARRRAYSVILAVHGVPMDEMWEVKSEADGSMALLVTEAPVGNGGTADGRAPGGAGTP